MELFIQGSQNHIVIKYLKIKLQQISPIKTNLYNLVLIINLKNNQK